MIIGYAVIGLGFFLEGSFRFVGTIWLAQWVWGIGYTFTSGARSAWLADRGRGGRIRCDPLTAVGLAGTIRVPTNAAPVHPSSFKGTSP